MELPGPATRAASGAPSGVWRLAKPFDASPARTGWGGWRGRHCSLPQTCALSREEAPGMLCEPLLAVDIVATNGPHLPRPTCPVIGRHSFEGLLHGTRPWTRAAP